MTSFFIINKATNPVINIVKNGVTIMSKTLGTIFLIFFSICDIAQIAINIGKTVPWYPNFATVSGPKW